MHTFKIIYLYAFGFGKLLKTCREKENRSEEKTTFTLKNEEKNI